MQRRGIAVSVSGYGWLRGQAGRQLKGAGSPATRLISDALVQAAAQRLTRAAGVALVSEGLLDLERRLPVAALHTRTFAFWEGWRSGVAHAQSPADLAAQVCTVKIKFQSPVGCMSLLFE